MTQPVQYVAAQTAPMMYATAPQVAQPVSYMTAPQAVQYAAAGQTAPMQYEEQQPTQYVDEQGNPCDANGQP
eukprot:CAMPEP_0176277752 /NCGR_PEP_ID=MMETSP0121_2-20121125/48440_1 /TAXON_ID=160619 /ORGANISM="Kryptoperidinium foliaceum, Strain CCMP 1326" /LENGTH=71 /DNA_ID=CAMNT_0017618063 /DNA_START=121 /DNA_END=333 /DNA_ORIENTATION=+